MKGRGCLFVATVPSIKMLTSKFFIFFKLINISKNRYFKIKMCSQFFILKGFTVINIPLYTYYIYILHIYIYTYYIYILHIYIYILRIYYIYYIYIYIYITYILHILHTHTHTYIYIYIYIYIYHNDKEIIPISQLLTVSCKRVFVVFVIYRLKIVTHVYMKL